MTSVTDRVTSHIEAKFTKVGDVTAPPAPSFGYEWRVPAATDPDELLGLIDKSFADVAGGTLIWIEQPTVNVAFDDRFETDYLVISARFAHTYKDAA